ncbi:threonylcarbamoyl-AMP synthase [Polaribacter sp. MSW13]|uniref:L-threonylcarbamoyladenylate synthase n=1 Tax=Polaribacter marinus TaxID=2916838 RepID=A0A9X1VLK0_9FLAO|nr:L-threonylcarbamoyladenylate synthase [Polaribacter marinus]MCI2227783.1 threonylcarbamoyl-AMP synthase [Polaribacter marinus]
MLSQISITHQYLKEGKTILYPTDTVWGLGCDATNFDSVSKIYQLKNREESKSLIVLVSSLTMLKKHVFVSDKVLDILKKTKKPTTIIYKNPKGFAINTFAKDNTIAIRIVQDDFCRKLIKRFGRPIISTSANVSGAITPKSFKEISQPILEGVDYIVDLHKNKVNTKSSTILKVDGNNIQVLRA